MNIVVIGAGPAGYPAAVRAAQRGARVTVVEAAQVGGTCLNWGCIPTKSLLASADVFSRVRTAADFGVRVSGDVKVDMEALVARKNVVVERQAKGIRRLLKERGIRMIEGRGRLTSTSNVLVKRNDGTEENLAADGVLIATGSRPADLPLFPVDGTRILSSNEAVHLTAVPDRLLVVGAGTIGCEFAFLFQQLGANVTVLELAPRVLPREDGEIAALLEREFKKRKIRLFAGVFAEHVEMADNAVRVVLEGGETVEADQVLVAVGRSANTEDLGLDTVGVRRDRGGRILVDEHMATTAPGVYAAGDITGSAMLAHVATREGIVAAEHMTGLRESAVRYDTVPSVIFTKPEIASVGFREDELQDREIPYRVGRFPFRALGKAQVTGEIVGLVKILVEQASGRLLGAHIMGAHASDLIHEMAVAIEAGWTARQVADTIHAHPTLAEGVMEAAADVYGEAIHGPVPKKGPSDNGGSGIRRQGAP